jgi:dTDP-glucose 4,6-dehydratase
MGKIILIAGGSGFIGSNLIIFLLKKTKYKIINVDKFTYAANINNLSKFKNHPRYGWILELLIVI